MKIAGLPPAMLQALLAAASPRIERVAGRPANASEPPVAPAVVPLATQAATSVQMLVAMAATEPASERRRRVAAETDRGLSMLERLHAELVEGSVAPARLHELVEWSESFKVPEEPQLAGLARDIELRVRVELAKHEANM